MLSRRLLPKLESCTKMLSQLSNPLVSPRICGFQLNPPLYLPKNPTCCGNFCPPLSFRRGIVPSTVELFKNSLARYLSGNACMAAAENQTSPVRLSRHGRADAQSALLEYLHSTRSLEFTLAEHMSKNCPVFLSSLLGNVEANTDMRRSLSRFLRYHPINEFEPFFESIGVRPSEVEQFLPRNLIYLSDDAELLENYHVLCNYGVPRTKIGKVYKEATEIFLYPCGVLPSKLQEYEKLGLAKPTIVQLVKCCPTLLVGNANLEFLQVLDKLRSFGVKLNCLKGGLSDKGTYNWNRILEMLKFLDTMGCSKNNLARLVKEHPKFVFGDSGKKVYLLVALLLKLGIKMDGMVTLFVQYPWVLHRKFMKNLWKSVNFLTRIGMETEDIARVVCSCPQVLGASSCRRPALVLPSLKMSAERLCDIIKEDPDQFGNLVPKKKFAAVPKMDGFFLQEKTDFLLRLGFVEDSDEMAKALSKFRGRGDQLQERFDRLINAGLDYHMVCEMIKVSPFILNQSADVLEKKINYLLNDLGYSLESLAVFPAVLGYNMEKMKLRFSMHKWLKDHGIEIQPKNRKMVKSTVALSTILACSEVRFVKQFINLHPEGPKEWEKLKKSMSSS